MDNTRKCATRESLIRELEDLARNGAQRETVARNAEFKSWAENRRVTPAGADWPGFFNGITGYPGS